MKAKINYLTNMAAVMADIIVKVNYLTNMAAVMADIITI